MLPPLVPTNPPRYPADPPVTLPLASELLIVAFGAFEPAKPPTLLFAPPLMVPLAFDAVIDPRFTPTRPPALFPCESVVAPPTVTLTAARAFEMIPLLSFWPTRPPATTPFVTPLFEMVLSTTVTLLMVPKFWPASTPTNCPGPSRPVVAMML